MALMEAGLLMSPSLFTVGDDGNKLKNLLAPLSRS